MRILQRDDLPLQLVDQYRAYSWAGFDTSPAFAYDSVREWAELTDYIRDIGYDAIRPLDQPLQAQEKEFLDKMAPCWRDTGYGMLHVPDVTSYSCSDPAQAQTLRPYLRKLRERYLNWLDGLGPSEIRRLVDDGPVKLDRGKGAPYWAPRTDRAVTVAYARLAQDAFDHDDLQQIVMAAGNARLPFVQTSYVRVDRSRKVSPVYVPDTSTLVHVGEELRPKVRRIGAMPFAANHLWAGVGNLLRTVMATESDRHTGTIQPVVAAAHRFKYSLAVDLSSYDTTVSIELLTALREEVLAPILHTLVVLGFDARMASLLLSCDEAFQRYQVLVPPFTRAEAARLVPAEGQIRSGENLTSWKGTVLNACRVEGKLQACGAARGAAVGYNYGDDTILFTDDSGLADRWVALGDWAGFKETVAPDASFLMRRIPQGYSYFGRLLGACVNREGHQEPRNVLDAAAAFATRYELLQGHPLQSTFREALLGWNRSSRWSEAARIAFGGASAVQLTLAAASCKMAETQLARTDALVEHLSALAASHVHGARPALRELVSQLEKKQRQVSWRTLQTAASEMSLAEARLMIKERSYTIR